jgi:dihydroflavonol-4-reductase
MKRVFVTGANSLLGTNLIHLLLSNGYFVKGLVRNITKYKGYLSPHLQLITGGLFDDYTKILADVDYVVHTAAITCQSLVNYNDYLKVNRNSTIQLFHAAIKCKVKKFVFVSSANTIGHGSSISPGNESCVVGKPYRDSLYARSKKETEENLLSLSAEMETIIVNPSFMLGAFDTKPSSGRIILMGWKKKIIFYPPGGKNFVHVKDVALGIVRSLESGRNGEKYLLVNENLSYREFFEKLNSVAYQNPLMIMVPRLLLTGIGIFGELLRKSGIETSLSWVNMRILCTSNFYSNTKSVTELGMNYMPIEDAIADALCYFKKNGVE